MRPTILLADDSPTIRRLVTQTFADANFRIVEVNNGDAAIRTFEEIRPSAVLADIYMPGKNGYQVCAYIRSHSELSRTPVVLLVGAFEAFDEDTAKQAGATASITKPFEPGALIELVKSILPAEGEEHPVETAAAVAPQSAVVSEPVKEASAAANPSAAVETAPPDAEDLFGLATIFKEEPAVTPGPVVTEGDIDAIVDRVIQKLSAEVVEKVAWEVVPDIAEKVVREELKRVK
jgi:CheY-like chemotaxis protein